MLYRLNRFSRLHNSLRVLAYSVLWLLPDWLKYGPGSLWRRFRRPYKFLRPGDTTIQVGAPWDTLRAGRSRAAYFARFVGRSGHALAVEPADSNVQALRSFAQRHTLPQLAVVPVGVWDKKTRLRFLINDEHPASNLVEEVIAEGRDQTKFEATEIDVDTLDNIVESRQIGNVKLLSITTNGSEAHVLRGAANTLAKVEYVSVITPEAHDVLSSHGFSPVGGDDRGYLYRKSPND